MCEGMLGYRNPPCWPVQAQTLVRVDGRSKHRSAAATVHRLWGDGTPQPLRTSTLLCLSSHGPGERLGPWNPGPVGRRLKRGQPAGTVQLRTGEAGRHRGER